MSSPKSKVFIRFFVLFIKSSFRKLAKILQYDLQKNKYAQLYSGFHELYFFYYHGCCTTTAVANACYTYAATFLIQHRI